MSDLCPFEELQAYLGTEKAKAETDPGVLSRTADQVEALLLDQCNRHDVPFSVAIPNRTEVHDGTGSSTLWVDYPIDTVASLELGHNPADPVEVLDPTDPDEIIVPVPPHRDRRIRRVSGGSTLGLQLRRNRRSRGPKFGGWDDPGFVHVEYDTLDDLPESAKLAVLRGTALIWAQRGLEEVNRQRMPDITLDLKKMIEEMPEWRVAVDLCYHADRAIA